MSRRLGSDSEQQTSRTRSADPAEAPGTATTPENNLPALRTFRAHLGAALQRERLRRGLTQGQLADFADVSIKYVGEIERGEANCTLEAIERLAQAVGWDPMNALDSSREPVTEGVRVLLLTELQHFQQRFHDMTKWLEALDPQKHLDARLIPLNASSLQSDIARKNWRARGRQSRRREAAE